MDATRSASGTAVDKKPNARTVALLSCEPREKVNNYAHDFIPSLTVSGMDGRHRKIQDVEAVHLYLL